MKKLAALVLLPVGLAFALPALADHKPNHSAPGGAGTITLAAEKAFVRYNPSLDPPGGVATLTGKLTGTGNGGQVVVLEQNPAPLADGVFQPAGREATTDDQGNFKFTGVVVPVNTQFRVRTAQGPQTVSDPATVQVRLKVSFKVSDKTPHKGERVRFRGRIWPEHDGKVVAIQRRKDGKFRTIKRIVARDVAEKPFSRYKTRVRVRSTGVYRVVARPGDEDHVSGFSRKRKLRVG